MNSTETPGGSGIPAGWYDDPSGPGLRWWDGEQWTEHVHTAESAAAATDASPEGEREAPPPELVKLRESIRGRGAKGVGLVLGGVVVVIVVVALLLSGGSDNNGGHPANPVPSAAKTAKAAATKAQIKVIDRQLQKKGLSNVTRKKLVAQKKKLEKSAKGSKGGKPDKQGKAAKGKSNANSAKGKGEAATQQPTPGEEGN